MLSFAVLIIEYYFHTFRTLNLYISRNFSRLNQLLTESENNKDFDHTNLIEQTGVNMWIIHIAGKENSELLSKVLSTVPLRFDSHVFGFYEYKDGKKIILCIDRFQE